MTKRLAFEFLELRELRCPFTKSPMQSRVLLTTIAKKGIGNEPANPNYVTPATPPRTSGRHADLIVVS